MEADRDHDRDKGRLLPEDDPVFVALGLSDHEGRMKPSRQAKYRQVEEFLRILDASVSEAIDKGHLRRPTEDDPLRMADLGCGNGYLTFAAQRFLTHVRGLPVVVTGVDVRQQSADHNTAVATGLGMAADFVVGGIADVVLDPAPEVVLALHACDTATDDALSRAVAWEAPLVLAAPCCHHDIAAQLRKTPAPAPYAMLTRHGILRERFADTLTDAVRASLLRIAGLPRRRDAVRREQAHPAQHAGARGAHRRPGVGRRACARSTTTWSRRGRSGPGSPSCSLVAMRSQILLGATAVPFLVAALLPGALLGGDEVTRFQDPEIVESSGLAVVDGLLVTTNDSGDSGRLFTVDPASGRPSGVTQWSAEPEDVEALAPAGGGEVWVGDIGDNRAERASVSVARVPVGRGSRDVDVPTYELVFPEGARDAESLLADPATNQLFVISKGVFGGAVYAAPGRLSADRPNRLTEVGPVLPIATDAAFFPDGRHVIVRAYSEAAVYSWPDLELLGRFGLPRQQQGEGIAVDLTDGTVYASSEGLHAPVLRIALPAAVRRAMAAHRVALADAARTAGAQPGAQPGAQTQTPPPGSREGTELPEQDAGARSAWGWAVGGLLGLGIVVVLVRALRPR